MSTTDTTGLRRAGGVVSTSEQITPADAIRWSEATGFDVAYDHDWTRLDDRSGRQCAACGMWYTQWGGDPCSAKAVRVAYWVPSRPADVPPWATLCPNPECENGRVQGWATCGVCCGRGYVP